MPADAQSPVAGVVDVVTSNRDFYRIDTAFTVPQVDPGSWRLRVHGLVDREVTMTFDDLLAADLVEAYVTLTCVSNTIGGDLAGNAKWLGLPVREVLAKAGPQAGADMVLSRSADGFTASTPIEALTDDRDALLAVGMNGDPLPAEHGFPVRMVVPGLYGYVSATKWVVDLEVTRFADAQAYWTARGWSAKGPIKTASRIEVPRTGASVPAGPVDVGGDGVGPAHRASPRSRSRSTTARGRRRPCRADLHRLVAAVVVALARRDVPATTTCGSARPTPTVSRRPESYPAVPGRGDRLARGLGVRAVAEGVRRETPSGRIRCRREQWTR